MGRLPATMYKTISVADRLCRSDIPAVDAGQAVGLLRALAAVECHASAGGTALVPPALMRDLVIITGRLAGRTWLAAHADTVAAFAALHSMTEPPPLAELDQVLACVLSDRFAVALTGGSGSPERRPPLRPGASGAGQAPPTLSASAQPGGPGGGP